MDLEIERIIGDFLKGIENYDAPASLAEILNNSQFPPDNKKRVYKEIEFELENRNLVQLIRGRDNSTLGGQCEYVINLNGIKYLKYLKNKPMTPEEQLAEIESKAKKYETEWKKGSEARLNSHEFISLFDEWYYESRDIFSDYFDSENINYKEFLEANLQCNGFTKGNQFGNLYSIFKILKKRGLKKVNNTLNTKKTIITNNIFLIHGRDETKKLEVARFLENDIKLNVTILHEKPNSGKTIIEKFEKYSNVDFAVAIWTGDDRGSLDQHNEILRKRARQNVIFETGFFFGKLGREKVIVLYENDVEIPSDYLGITYVPFDGQWKDDLRKEVSHIYENF
ncbi:nucleotide-binding protein [uncultured Algoriphagus sp.]|uniref:nucleotide-binding protein n=1 Tax=uncultured Algoriphagus sp. TaxID=417365 RepID=UPI0030EC717C|tara:strand:+ start:11488 stop:12504 length:1017 start_codon:yes stop_codon:yes gene_type:complete